MFANQHFAAFLFDMDGTILTSTLAAEHVWGQWAARHGIDLATFLPTIHGVRAVDTIAKQNLPGIDPQVEAQKITAAEIAYVDGIAPVPGAGAFLHALPANRWAIVTSAPKALALRRIAAAGLPVPDVLVTADDVTQGKPAPDCYVLAANKLGVAITDCLVFEDADAGILAAERAGASVLVIQAIARHEARAAAHPCTPDYGSLNLTVNHARQLPLSLG